MKYFLLILTALFLILLITACPLFDFEILPRTNPWDPGAVDGKYRPDSTFGENGVMRVHDDIFNPNEDNEVGNDVAVDDIGRVIVAGFITTRPAAEDRARMAVFRFTPQGFLDDTFGPGWVADSPGVAGGEASFGNDLVLSEDAILVVGNVDTGVSSDLAVWKVTFGGTFDGPYGGGDGVFTMDGISGTANGNEWGGGIVYVGGGNVVVTAAATDGADQVISLVALDGSGSLDNGFNFGNGYRNFNMAPAGESEWCNAATLSPFGDIVVTGNAGVGPGGSQDIFVLRVSQDGTIVHGEAYWNNTETGDGNDSGRAVVVDEQDRIYVAGRTVMPNGRRRMVVIRFNSDMGIDNGYGVNGAVIIDRSSNSNLFSLDATLDHAGRIVLVGETVPYEGDSRENLTVVRILHNGELDPDFGIGGILSINYSTADPFQDRGAGVAQYPDNRIVVAGSTWNEGEARELTVWRFNNNP